MSDEDIRNYVAQVAGTISGLGYRETTRSDYLALIAPDGVEHDPKLEDSMGHMWSCALTTMGLWRKLGVDHPLLREKYVIGKAMEWVSQIGEDKKAECHPDGKAIPQVGDAIQVNGGFHVIAAVTKEYGQMSVGGVSLGTFVDTVEGGQSDPGGMCIKAFQGKVLGYQNGVLMVGKSKVFRWYDCTKLGIKLPVASEPTTLPSIAPASSPVQAVPAVAPPSPPPTAIQTVLPWWYVVLQSLWGFVKSLFGSKK